MHLGVLYSVPRVKMTVPFQRDNVIFSGSPSRISLAGRYFGSACIFGFCVSILLHNLSSVERDLISQHEMPEDLSKVGILLICRVSLDRVNRFYLGMKESVPSTLVFMGFIFYKNTLIFMGIIKNMESARNKRAVEFSPNEQQKG